MMQREGIKHEPVDKRGYSERTRDANAHLQNTFNGKVKILDSFAMESIGGTHHSVRMMERAYEIISKALK